MHSTPGTKSIRYHDILGRPIQTRGQRFVDISKRACFLPMFYHTILESMRGDNDVDSFL